MDITASLCIDWLQYFRFNREKMYCIKVNERPGNFSLDQVIVDILFYISSILLIGQYFYFISSILLCAFEHIVWKTRFTNKLLLLLL